MHVLDLVRRNRVQKGELIETPTAFFVRCYVNESYANGRPKTKCEKLADRSDIYRSFVEVKPLFDAAMERVNGKREIRATGQTSLADYWEKFYFLWVAANKAAATSNGYKLSGNLRRTPRCRFPNQKHGLEARINAADWQEPRYWRNQR